MYPLWEQIRKGQDMADRETKAYLKEFYTVEQLSTELDITQQTLRELIRNGDLKAGKLANKYVIQREDIKEYLDKSR